jgi:hypothetical protein
VRVERLGAVDEVDGGVAVADSVVDVLGVGESDVGVWVWTPLPPPQPARTPPRGARGTSRVRAELIPCP